MEVCAANCGCASKLKCIARPRNHPWMFDEEESQERIGRSHPRHRQERNGDVTYRRIRARRGIDVPRCHDTRKTTEGETLRDTDLSCRGTKMPDEEWIKTLEDGRKVKFIYQELPEDGAFITAQLAGNEIVYSVVLNKAGNPLSREAVESHFKGEFSKK